MNSLLKDVKMLLVVMRFRLCGLHREIRGGQRERRGLELGSTPRSLRSLLLDEPRDDLILRSNLAEALLRALPPQVHERHCQIFTLDLALCWSCARAL